MDPIRTRQAQGTTLINAQKIHDVKYATKLLPTGVLASSLDFFTSAPLADVTYDNYANGGNLVDSGKEFTIYQVGVQLTIGTTPTIADYDLIIGRCVLALSTAQKEYGRFPILLLPSGGGLAVQGSQVGVAGTAVQGVTNGMPTRNGMFKLAAPLIIGANQSFKATLYAPNAVGFPAITLTGTTYIRILLDGVEQRAAA